MKNRWTPPLPLCSSLVTFFLSYQLILFTFSSPFAACSSAFITPLCMEKNRLVQYMLNYTPWAKNISTSFRDTNTKLKIRKSRLITGISVKKITSGFFPINFPVNKRQCNNNDKYWIPVIIANLLFIVKSVGNNRWQHFFTEIPITQVNILSTLEHQKRIGYTKVFEVADYDERVS